MPEKIWYLKQSGLLAELGDADLRELEAQATQRTFARGELIYFPDEPGGTVLLVAQGRVRLKDLTPEGKEIILAFIDQGEIFGELAIFDGAVRGEFAEAVEPTEVIALPKEAVLSLLARRPTLALGLTKLIGLRRHRVENRLRNVLFRSNRERLAHVLLELLQSHGQQNGDRWDITLKLSHQELASLIGATRESVTLLLGRFQLENKIKVRRRSISVLDPDALAAETIRTAAPTAAADGATRLAAVLSPEGRGAAQGSKP